MSAPAAPKYPPDDVRSADDKQGEHMTQNVPAVTPMTMLQAALDKGVSVEQLTQLLAMKERWEAAEARKAFVVALNAFKANPPAVLKSKAVSFGGAGKTSYKHAQLDDASEIIGAALAKCDISHRWNVEQSEGGRIKVTCILTHAMGHSESVAMEASPDTSGSKNSIQAIGSTSSYLQRYTLFAASGIAPKNADDDGQGGGGKTMPEAEKTLWLASIDECATIGAAETLWSDITKATSAVGDIEAHEELRAAMTARRRALKGAK